MLYDWFMYKYLFFGSVAVIAILLFSGRGVLPVADEPTAPVWEQKRTASGEPLRIGLITDTHVDSVRPPSRILEERTMPDKYTGPMQDFVDRMQAFDPAFNVHVGDLIEGTGVDPEVGEWETRFVRDAFSALSMPMYWVIGNHDLRSISRKDFRQELEIDYTNHYFDEGDYRFVIIDSNYRFDGVPNHVGSGDPVSGYIPRETLAWLTDVLATDLHVYVFMHHSAVPGDFTGKNQIDNHQAVRDLFASYNVSAVFSGHIEKRFQGDFDGVTYYTLPGIVKSPDYLGAHYTLSVQGDAVDLRLHYRDSDNGLVEEPFFVEEKMIDRIIAAKAKAEAEAAVSDEGDEGGEEIDES